MSGGTDRSGARQLAWLIALTILAASSWIVLRESEGSLVEGAEGAEVRDPVPNSRALTAGSPTVVDTAVRDQAETNPDPSRVLVTRSATRRTLHGTVRRRGLIVPGREVSVYRSQLELADLGRSHAVAQTDSAGRYAVALEPGDYSVVVVPAFAKYLPTSVSTPVVSLAGIGPPPYGNWAEVTLAASDVQLDLNTDPGRVYVDVVDEDGGAVPDVVIRFEYITTASPEMSPLREYSFDVATDAAGRAQLDEVPFGWWRTDVAAGARPVLSQGDREPPILLTPAQPEGAARIVVDAIEARLGRVELRIIDERGARLPVEDAWEIRLRELETGRVHQSPSAESERGLMLATVPFLLLPRGRYEPFILEDTSTDETVRFAPVDLLPSAPLVVTAGRLTRAELPVRQRARVRIRGNRTPGVIDSTTRLVVRRAEDPQVVLPRWGPTDEVDGRLVWGPRGDWHFEGFLTPGTYSLEFTAPDGRSCVDTLVVGHASLDRRHPLPW